MATLKTLLLQLHLLLRTTLYLHYIAVIPDWWWRLLNFQSGIVICQPMTVLFLSCKREATHGPHGVSKDKNQWLVLNIFHLEILWAESLLVVLSTLSWRLPRNIGNLKYVVIPSDGSGNIKSCSCFGIVTPIRQHQVNLNVLILGANGQWNLPNIFVN